MNSSADLSDLALAVCKLCDQREGDQDKDLPLFSDVFCSPLFGTFVLMHRSTSIITASPTLLML